MVSNSKMPTAIIAYLRMPDDELRFLMNKYPYYTMPKIAYAIKHKDEVNKEDIELYGYDKNIVVDWLSEDPTKLIAAAEKDEQEKLDALANPVPIKVSTIETKVSKKTIQTSTTNETNSEEIKTASSKEFKTKSIENVSDSDSEILFDINDDTIEFDMAPVDHAEEKESSEIKETEKKAEKTTSKKKKTKKVTKKKVSKKVVSKNESKNDEAMDFFSWLNTTKHESHEDVGLDDISEIEAELDEDFIQKEIDKKKIKKTSKNIGKSIDESLEEPDIITETMAKIYADQGNKEKAIDIYNKLIEKFPEKSTYFANSIEKIKNE